MTKSQKQPLIGIITCHKPLGLYQVQSVNEFYLNALAEYGASPVILPHQLTGEALHSLLAQLDGVLLTGSHSNVHPQLYGATHQEPRLDGGRDRLAFAIIEYSKQHALPVLGICRGFQEMNVALGGSLHHKVYQLAGAIEHREPESENFSIKYADQHSLRLAEDSWLAGWLDCQSIEVNSLHNQGVNRLADSLIVEAQAEDGLVEAYRLAQHPFFYAVQWHPEWQATRNPISQAIFTQFVKAASLHQQ
ncbi:gamma-glutamyl-gamma-aminobutyrate hydrolase family protein [Agarivorans sp. 1_MG-2023]|uniref:gamma-glutamyl-gamma-aminobutyrate hydrolase family protein n=1 Tax=Agarivorans sp. 1_MG-2023 TaxID=3062634 RepID=UPI0026E3738A|nr:gamma-glutamyl-gamma-aminobutyrate hydrolase family protein [Agarivorans sp. 1_MG-2023]MDO6764371.1 gamma-glutamyl-gamma-aminobutyrate hydrolase family protein [Agarivorans sp. 1_MG-2023]